jgi:hypothetical protein
MEIMGVFDNTSDGGESIEAYLQELDELQGSGYAARRYPSRVIFGTMVFDDDPWYSEDAERLLSELEDQSETSPSSTKE